MNGKLGMEAATAEKLRTGQGYAIYLSYRRHGTPSHEERERIAGLFAASEDMLEALELASVELDYAASALADLGRDEEAMNAAQRAMECRTAINLAKAGVPKRGKE